MILNKTYIDRNRASTERIRSLAARLSDDEMQTRVGQHWTVAIVFAHLAFWDRRVLYVMDMTEKEGKVHIPNIDAVANDLSLPLWAAIPPRAAVHLAIETAESLDRRLEVWREDYLHAMFDVNQRWVERYLHRDGHLDEAVAALKSRK